MGALGLLVAGCGRPGCYGGSQTRVHKAIITLGAAVDQFQLEYHQYPTSLQELTSADVTNWSQED